LKEVIDNITVLATDQRLLNSDAITIGCADDVTEADCNRLMISLKKLMPWRKGPYSLYGIHIDSEWRSDWKWNRLKNHVSPLNNRLVLDVGCGNGYHCWRILGADARCVIGIDPFMLNVIQFQLVKKLYGDASVFVLPFGLEDLPGELKLFDTVFSMGVLYHRRSPIDHLLQLKNCLRKGGELVLETLVIDGNLGESLVPENRYANMRNVWFIPSCPTLFSWLKRCGFSDIRLIDVSVTLVEEQRSTDWMTFKSLKDFLASHNHNFTIEGYPAPKRAVVIATLN